MLAPQPFWLKVQIGPLLLSRPFVVLASGTYTEVRKRVSAFTTVTWSRDETPCPRSLLGLDRNRPSCCTSHMLLRDTRLALEATKPLHKVVLGSYHSVTSGAWVEETTSLDATFSKVASKAKAAT